SRTAVLTFDSIAADHYQLRVLDSLVSTDGVHLAEVFTSSFTAVTDLTQSVSMRFTRARSSRRSGTVSYDVSISNTGANTLVLLFILQLNPQEHFEGEPQGNVGRAANGAFLVDLSKALPNGVLAPGQATIGQTITVSNPGGQRVAF